MISPSWNDMGEIVEMEEIHEQWEIGEIGETREMLNRCKAESLKSWKAEKLTSCWNAEQLES